MGGRTAGCNNIFGLFNAMVKNANVYAQFGVGIASPLSKNNNIVLFDSDYVTTLFSKYEEK
jgi:hypothetical protein